MVAEILKTVGGIVLFLLALMAGVLALYLFAGVVFYVLVWAMHFAEMYIPMP